MSMPRAPWCRACWRGSRATCSTPPAPRACWPRWARRPTASPSTPRVALAEHLSIQYGDKGICVSVLCPQAVDTNMLRMAGATAASVDGVLNTDAVAQTVIEVDGRRDLPDPAASRGEGVHDAQDRRPSTAGCAACDACATRPAKDRDGAREQERRSLARSQSPYSFLAKDPAYALEKELGVDRCACAPTRSTSWAPTTWPIPRWPSAACGASNTSTSTSAASPTSAA